MITRIIQPKFGLLATARSTGRNRVLTMFQPHRYNPNQGCDRNWRCLRSGDRVVITEVYPRASAHSGSAGRPLPMQFQRMVSRRDLIAFAHVITSRQHLASGISSLASRGKYSRALSILAGGVGGRGKIKGDRGRRRRSTFARANANTLLAVGGPAQFWTSAHGEAFAELIRFCRRENLRSLSSTWSNLLVRDGGITGWSFIRVGASRRYRGDGNQITPVLARN